MFGYIKQMLLAVAIVLCLCFVFHQLMENKLCRESGGTPVKTDWEYVCIRGK